MRLQDVVEAMATPTLPEPLDLDPRAVRLVPPRPDALGVSLTDGKLHVAFASQPSPALLAEVAASIGMPITPVVVRTDSFDAALKRAAELRDAAHVPIETLLDTALVSGASDIHLAVGERPVYRIGGLLQSVGDTPELTATEMDAAARYLAPDTYVDGWNGDHDAAFSYQGSRFRLSLLRQRQAVSASIRVIPGRIPRFDALGLPEIVRSFVNLQHGLVLFAGPTGSGKSTSLAALLDIVNEEQSRNIITIEDPIEYVHGRKKSLVRQREVGDDTMSFSAALRAAMRQDPDVILVGEMRDLDTIATVLTAAETGHLVFSTVHASDARGVVERIIDIFPEGQQQQIRTQLAACLAGVVAQTLLPAFDRPGERQIACEIMLPSDAVRAHIRSGETHQLNNDIRTGIADRGMMPFDASLAKLVVEGKVEKALAAKSVVDEELFGRYLSNAYAKRHSATAA